jgi:hypothetical protein
MSFPVVLALIENMTVEDVEPSSADDTPLSEKLDRLSALHGEIAWPESVTTVMAELGAATGRMARLLECVSGDVSPLPAQAVEVSPPPAGRRHKQPSSDPVNEPHGSGASAKTA